MKWRIRKGFQEGKIGSITIFGYRRNTDGQLEIEPQEAEIVRMIFCDYLSGMGQTAIAHKLNEMGIPTRQGNLWTNPRIKELLTNEKYIGNMLLQKYYRNNHIEKIKTKNHGELPQYLVEDSHEAIIDIDTFQSVQEMLKQREQQYSHEGNMKRYPLSGMIQCGYCGKNYQRKMYPQGGTWICATFLRRGKKYCPKAKQLEGYIATHTNGFTDEYRKKYERFEELQSELDRTKAEYESAQARYKQIQDIIQTLKSDVLTVFDDSVWNAVIANVTVFHDGSMVFQFKDGTEIKE